MRVIGVIDLRNGVAVHARGGDRSSYRPIDEVGGVAIRGDALALARTYVDVLRVKELYVADLDAIERGPDALNASVIGSVAALGVPVWVDAGVSMLEGARAVLAAGASVVVVGLETLSDFDVLGEICSGVGGARVAFSLDLRNGTPITVPNAHHSALEPREHATRAARAGARNIIVLDLARVGTSMRVDSRLAQAIRGAAPDVALLTGGGVRDAADLDALADAGCDGALVATALLTGALNV
jgi:HisA/HisF family protein